MQQRMQQIDMQQHDQQQHDQQQQQQQQPHKGLPDAVEHKRPQKQSSSIYDIRSNKRRNAILFVAALATMIVPCR